MEREAGSSSSSHDWLSRSKDALLAAGLESSPAVLLVRDRPEASSVFLRNVMSILVYSQIGSGMWTDDEHTHITKRITAELRTSGETLTQHEMYELKGC